MSALNKNEKDYECKQKLKCSSLFSQVQQTGLQKAKKKV